MAKDMKAAGEANDGTNEVSALPRLPQGAVLEAFRLDDAFKKAYEAVLKDPKNAALVAGLRRDGIRDAIFAAA